MTPFAFLIAVVIVASLLWAWRNLSQWLMEGQDLVFCIADRSDGRGDFRGEKAQTRAAMVPLFSFLPGGTMNTALDGNFGHGMIDGKKEKLVTDLKGVLADADDLLKEVGNSTAEEFAALRTKVEGKLGEARAKIESARGVAVEKAQNVGEYVSANPGKSLGVAAVAGLVIGLILSRR